MRIGWWAVLLVGCVPKQEHETLMAESQGKETELARLVGECTEVEAERNGLREDLDWANRILDKRRRELAEAVSKETDMQRSIEEMQEALKELDMRRARAEAALEEFRELVMKFQGMIDAGTLSVKVIDGRMVVQLPTDILFDPGSAALSKDGEKAMAEVAQVLQSIEKREFQVAGHTDNQPIATAKYPSNWHLGSDRAIAVTRLLVQNGLTADRVSASSYGEYKPADTNRTNEGRANNRRIEIIVLPDLEALPGFEELKALGQ
ncbi:MAG: OmpA family protein [Alphaproteobacteria bacterium]|nr:OmpA family protein [Alphaproteobacteria bacterium]